MQGRGQDELSFATNKKHTIKFKIVFIGDQSVGKSSIINRFIKNEFDAAHNPTVGIDFVSKNLVVHERSIRLQLWDTAGQERFRSLIPGYLRDSHAIFVVYDITSAESYDNLMGWIDYSKEYRGEDVLIFVIGNKNDDEEHRAVPTAQAEQKFTEMGLQFIEVSAKTGDGLDKLFSQACSELLKSPDLETTLTHGDLPKPKKQVATLTGEKERPIKKDTKEGAQGGKAGKGDKQEVRGSKLGSSGKGSYVKQKNCC